MSEAQGHSNDVDFDFDDSALDQFDGVTVEGGVNTDEEDDNCVGGACKIQSYCKQKKSPVRFEQGFLLWAGNPAFFADVIKIHIYVVAFNAFYIDWVIVVKHNFNIVFTSFCVCYLYVARSA